MEAEDAVLAFFDLYWFRRLILRRSPPPLPKDLIPPITVNADGVEFLSSEPPPLPEEIIPSISVNSDGDKSLSSELPPQISAPTLLLRRHRRSRSDEFEPIPTLQIPANKLQTIFSGKTAAENPYPVVPQAVESRERKLRWDRGQQGTRRRRKKGESKSLSDLEFKELKGLMDLGFTFSEAEAADPRLISIVPGLHRLREVAGKGVIPPPEDTSLSAPEGAEESRVCRPYLSEAWDVTAEERGSDHLKSWEIPPAGSGVDLRDHLRLWAQSVASAVR